MAEKPKKRISKNEEIKEEEDSEAQEKKLVEKGKKLFQYAKESRRKYDWEWLVRNLFYRGYHYATYNRGTNTVTLGNRTGVRIPINLLYAHLRGVRNQITSFKPKWEVLPNV